MTKKNCNHDLKPHKSRTCNQGPCRIDAEWTVGDWSEVIRKKTFRYTLKGSNQEKGSGEHHFRIKFVEGQNTFLFQHAPPPVGGQRTQPCKNTSLTAQKWSLYVLCIWKYDFSFGISVRLFFSLLGIIIVQSNVRWRNTREVCGVPKGEQWSA